MTERIHTYLAPDDVEHVLEGDECPCGPSIEHVDGATQVIHRSAEEIRMAALNRCCSRCGRETDKLYGGEGCYPAMCHDCWTSDA